MTRTVPVSARYESVQSLGNESNERLRFYNYRIDQRYFDLRAGLATA
jgi:hypothetical protein